MKTLALLFCLLSFACAANAQSLIVNEPSPNETVTSPFTLSAAAGTCGGDTVRTLGWSLDNSSDTTLIHAQTAYVTVPATPGPHVLHVKAWAGSNGQVCVVQVGINVEAPQDGPTVPADAVTVGNIDTLAGWIGEHDGATSGNASADTKLVVSPSRDGNAREFVSTFTKSGGVRYSVSFADDTESANFLYDAWIYVASPNADLANLELDLNQTMQNGQTVIFGFQCDGYSGVWDYSANLGTPQHPKGAWIHSKAACNVRNWTPDAWHHVQIEYSRDDTGIVNYQAVWLDGTEQPINATALAARSLGWGKALSTNFQVDGLGASGKTTLYLDDLTISRW